MSASHRDTDFDLLDRVSRHVDTTARDLVTGTEFVRGAVVLATCNRFEAYLELDEPLTAAGPIAAEAVFSTLAGAIGADADALRATTRVMTGTEVVHHLFAVSAGLESMVVGEDEISGQVQRALGTARAEGTASGGLERLFQQATRTSRAVRGKGDLGGADRSVARLALELASSRIPDWATTPILIVGTGRYAATTIAALHARGATDLRVFSATGRASRFASRFGIRAEPSLTAAIADAAVVITCTARYTVTPEAMPQDGRPRLVIDLGLPRNVDPAVREIDGVELLDLEVLALHAPLPELEPGAWEVVASATQEFAASSLAAPAIVAMREHVFGALDAELARLRARGDDPRAEQALRHLASVILHTPSVRARELAAAGRADEFAAAVSTLFGVEVPDAHAAPEADAAPGVA